MSNEAITCPHCGKTSFNRNDVLNRYCGYCHIFHDDGIITVKKKLSENDIQRLRRAWNEAWRGGGSR